MPIDPRIHVLTLGVSDLERSLAFYRDGLGLPSEGITGTQYQGDDQTAAGAVAMFTLSDGLILSLYPHSELAKDAGAELPVGSAISIGQLVGSREEVDRVLELARHAGGRVIGEPHDRPWGIYSGYFADPDEHLWEIIHFPGR
jgi:catechol 2,3-dioxygenase-like lactoylglutathione lyase family enzyme